jgi:starch synthase (maltosyl-transferring)
LRELRTLRVHETDNEAIIAYSKHDPASDDLVLIVVNLDPRHPQEGIVSWDLDLDRFTVLDEVSGELFEWSRSTYVKLDPQRAVAHIAGRR